MTALRSGEYRQCKEQLGKVVGHQKEYCCEGVAAERYGAQLDFAVEWDGGALLLNEFTEYAPDSFWVAMGLGVGEVVGAASEFTFVLPDGQTVHDSGASAVDYMALNDDGLTFAQIADLIEWQHLAQ